MMIITLASFYYANGFFGIPGFGFKFYCASLFDHVHPFIIFHITLPDQTQRKKAHVEIFV